MYVVGGFEDVVDYGLFVVVIGVVVGIVCSFFVKVDLCVDVMLCKWFFYYDCFGIEVEGWVGFVLGELVFWVCVVGVDGEVDFDQCVGQDEVESCVLCVCVVEIYVVCYCYVFFVVGGLGVVVVVGRLKFRWVVFFGCGLWIFVMSCLRWVGLIIDNWLLWFFVGRLKLVMVVQMKVWNGLFFLGCNLVRVMILLMMLGSLSLVFEFLICIEKKGLLKLLSLWFSSLISQMFLVGVCCRCVSQLIIFWLSNLQVVCRLGLLVWLDCVWDWFLYY